MSDITAYIATAVLGIIIYYYIFTNKKNKEKTDAINRKIFKFSVAWLVIIVIMAIAIEIFLHL